MLCSVNTIRTCLIRHECRTVRLSHFKNKIRLVSDKSAHFCNSPINQCILSNCLSLLNVFCYVSTKDVSYHVPDTPTKMSFFFSFTFLKLWRDVFLLSRQSPQSVCQIAHNIGPNLQIKIRIFSCNFVAECRWWWILIQKQKAPAVSHRSQLILHLSILITILHRSPHSKVSLLLLHWCLPTATSIFP